MTVYTVGHSTRTLAEVEALLRANDITILCDIRSYPGSRHVPQWNKESLELSMPVDIRYVHQRGLGGRRKALPVENSVNTAWRNASFRGYADYMQTVEFRNNLEILVQVQKNSNVAIMCSEAVPWRCHRSLVTDALLVRDVDVYDIISKPEPTLAKLTKFAHVDGTDITYPGE